ncbi:hypothetical protein EXS65_04090, partial [Candidatus Peribacteria bacterium]|nr:hypothetical protein [Candidatus Peribacteria bacterium]
MNLLAFIIGIAIPLALGYLTLLLLERKSPVLGPVERWFYALVLGPTAFALLAFVLHILGLTKLNLFGFLLPSIVVLIALLALAKRTHAFAARLYQPAFREGIPLPKFIKISIILLCVWTGIKILAGSIDLISVPTYWDDSFNNWNMRGKMFYVTEMLTLEIPIGNGMIQNAGGVGSYPSTVPLLKTWLSTLRGSWEEPLVNSLHLIWFIGLLGSFFFGLRRRMSPLLSLGGTCFLVSLPLLLIQATNPYADIFMASHLLVAILCLTSLASQRDPEKSRTWITLFGLSLGLLFFTKNEATVLYAPLLTLMLLRVLFEKKRTGILSGEQARRLFGLSLLLAMILAAPWLLFKWSQGLTFGNAKSVSGLSIVFSPLALKAIWYHLTREPNWLLLPLLLPLAIVLSGKKALRLPDGILTVFLILVISAQFFIFTFTPLAPEAIMQTGLSRGLLHVMP